MKLFKEKKVERIVYVATELRKYREKKGRGLRQVSRAIQIAPATLSAIEMGKHTTTKETAMLIEEYLLNC